MGPATTVRLEKVCKTYDSTTVVADVNLDIQKGEFLTLLGSSGSGKTTTLMMIAGFVKPDSGRIYLSDQLINDLPPEKRGLGVVFQSYALFPHMNVHDNVAFPLKMRGISATQSEKQVEEVLSVVSLGDFAQRRIHELSGGQQQRVALARALVFEPPVLLMDEPLGALDRLLREQLQSEIKRIQKKFGLTIVYVTHDQEEALSMSDRVAVMSEGSILQLGTPEDVYENPTSVFVAGFLGESNFIHGHVVKENGGTYISPTAASTLRLAGRQTDYPAGEAAKAVIRPEAMRLSSEDRSGANSVIGRVIERDFLGNSVKLRVQTELGTLLVRVPRGDDAHMYVPGDDIVVWWEAKDMIILKG